jgi:hypothetical protein
MPPAAELSLTPPRRESPASSSNLNYFEQRRSLESVATLQGRALPYPVLHATRILLSTTSFAEPIHGRGEGRPSLTRYSKPTHLRDGEEITMFHGPAGGTRAIVCAAILLAVTTAAGAQAAASVAYTDLYTLGRPDGFTSAQPGSRDFQVAAAGQLIGSGAAADGTSHALLWSGVATSGVDLNPAGFTSSTAYAVRGAQRSRAASAATPSTATRPTPPATITRSPGPSPPPSPPARPWPASPPWASSPAGRSGQRSLL